MKKLVLIMLLVLPVLLSSVGCGPSKSLSLDDRRIKVTNMEADTLQRLYSEAPTTKEKIKNAPGYGVFKNANVNLIIASAGGGYGVVVDNTTKTKTYMKMAMGGLGLGLGVKDYRVVLVFRDKETMNKFVTSGWEFGAHADAAAKAGDAGGEMSGEGDIHAGIEVFSMTESGLALQATVTGTKYWQDKSLN